MVIMLFYPILGDFSVAFLHCKKTPDDPSNTSEVRILELLWSGDLDVDGGGTQHHLRERIPSNHHLLCCETF